MAHDDAAIAAAEEDVAKKRETAALAYADWISAEAAALESWALEQAKLFVTVQHEISTSLGAAGVGELRTSAVEIARKLSDGAPSSLQPLARHDADHGKVHPANADLATAAASIREKHVKPLADLLIGFGYDGGQGWNDFDWYEGGRQQSMSHGGLTFEGEAGQRLARLIRVYNTALTALNAALAARDQARENAKQRAAKLLWGDD